MSDTGYTCQGCGKPQKPGTAYCTSCGLPVGGTPGVADDIDTPTVIAPGKRAAAGSAGSGGSAAPDQPPTVAVSPARPATDAGAQGGQEWRPGQDWSPRADWQQEQQVPWWLAPQQGQQPGGGQQGFSQQGLGNQGFGPQGTQPQGAGPLGPTGLYHQPPSSGGKRPSRLPVIAVSSAAVALLVAGVSAYVLLSSSHSTNSTGAPPTSGPTQTIAPTSSGPTPTQTSTTSGTSEQQAATSLNSLLAQSSQDRNAINTAYNNGMACTTLASDESTFKQAAANRRALLTQLGSLQGASTLPTQMLTDLTNAWQVSIQVDNDYAQWIADETATGCTQQDPSFQAATGPNQEATNDKTAFISLWNPLASQYSLPAYDQSTL